MVIYSKLNQILLPSKVIWNNKNSIVMRDERVPLTKTYDSWNLMALNIKLLRNVGIIPNEGTSKHSWKWKLNRFCHSLLFLIYLPSLILQFLSLYFYWGNIILIVQSIGTTSGLMACYFPALYMIVKWEDFYMMMYRLETNSIFSAEMVRQNDEQMKKIHTSKRSAIILTWITIASIVAIGTSFDMIPLARLAFSKSETESLQNVDHTSQVFKYLVMVMWLPGQLSEEYWYWYIYTVQALIIFVACSYLTAILPFIMTMIVYTETQFRIVSSSLNEIDERYKEEDVESEVLKSETDMKIGVFRHSVNYEDVLSLHPEVIEELISTKTEDGLIDSTARTLTTLEHDTASCYLVECIKLHQAVIE